MIEKITMAIVDESGNFIEVPKSTNGKVESNLEETTADFFTAICSKNNNVEDEKIRLSEKFRFANHLQNYLKENTEND